MDTIPPSAGEPLNQSRTAPRRASGLLLCIVVGIPVALLVLTFPIMNSSFFKKYGDSLSVTAQRSLFESTNRKCDVLIYGDSTAEAGVDPAIVENATHLTACNIATGGPTLSIMGLDPFNKYLARNPKPRYLVLQFSAADLHEIKPSTTDLEHLDGIIESVRYYGWLNSLPIFLHTPDYIIGLMNYTYKSGSTQMFLSLAGKRPKYDPQHSDSYLIYPRLPLKSCPIYNGGSDMPDTAWIKHLRQLYGDSAGTVFVDISPTSPCNTLYPSWKTALAGSTDNDLELYPTNLFVDGTYHCSREGAIRRSNEVAEQILRAEAGGR